MVEWQYGQILKSSWEKMKVNYGMILAVFLIVIIVAAAFMQISKVFEDAGGLGKILGQVVSFSVQTFLTIGFIRCLLAAADDQKIEFSTLFSGGDVFLNFLLANLAYSLLCMLGFFLLIIPGIFWAMKYFFVTYLIADRGMGIKEAFVMSGEMTNGYKWKLFCLMSLTGLINIGGALCLGLGLLVTVPWTSLAVPIAFRMISSDVAAIEKKDVLV